MGSIFVRGPSFDEKSSDSNIDEFTQPTLGYGRNFDKGTDELGRTVETAFSKTTPWKKLTFDSGILKHVVAPEVIRFNGGSSGKLAKILESSEFSMDMKLNEDDPSETPIFEQI